MRQRRARKVTSHTHNAVPSVANMTEALQSQPQLIVQQTLNAIGNGDLAGITADFADDAVWEVVGGSFLPHGNRFIGKTAIDEDFFGRTLPELFDLTEPFRLDIPAMHTDVDAGTVVVEWVWNAKARRGGDYSNRYCVVFEVRGGLVREVREYVDSAYAQNLLVG